MVWPPFSPPAIANTRAGAVRHDWRPAGGSAGSIRRGSCSTRSSGVSKSHGRGRWCATNVRSIINPWRPRNPGVPNQASQPREALEERAMTDILGISAFYHDSAACLVRDGEIVAAAQEERFTRKKHDPGFPTQSVRYCLREGGVSLNDLRYVAFYDKPLVKFERLLETYLAFAPRGIRSFWTAMPVWLKDKLFLKRLLQKELLACVDGREKPTLPPLLFGEHHESHAASAFYPSPFETAAVLCLDGVGEWATTSAWLGRGN